MQESRLFKLLYYLLSKGKATAPELAEKFEVSVRTIYRDIDALSSAGIPIYAVSGKGGGISLLEDFVMNKTVFSEEEQSQILLALQSMSAASADMEAIHLKLSAMFQSADSNWIQVDFSRWGNTQTDQNKFTILKAAILNRQLLSFHYYNTSGSCSDRQVKPAKLTYKANAWYLQAYCMEKKDFRIFKINRMDEIRLLDETFTDFLSPPPVESSAQEAHYPLIRLLFRKEAAYRVYDEFDHTCIEQDENGDLIASCHMPEDAWLYGYLLSFCGYADVLEPKHIRKKLAEMTAQMNLIYSKDFKT